MRCALTDCLFSGTNALYIRKPNGTKSQMLYDNNVSVKAGEPILIDESDVEYSYVDTVYYKNVFYLLIFLFTLFICTTYRCINITINLIFLPDNKQGDYSTPKKTELVKTIEEELEKERDNK